MFVQLELEIESLQRKVGLVEEENDQNVSKLHDAQAKLSSLSSIADEHDRWEDFVGMNVIHFFSFTEFTPFQTNSPVNYSKNVLGKS